MICIVAYDIEKNRVRNQVAKYLKSNGVRIQKSVFAVDIPGWKFKGFIKGLEKIVADESDTIAVFRLCEGCKAKAVQINKSDPHFYIF